MANNTIAVLRQMLASLDDAKKYQSLRDVMSTMNAPDLAAVFEDLPEEKMPVLFRLCPKDLAADVFAELSSETQEALIRGLTDRELTSVVEEMCVDDATDLVEEMPASVVKRILAQAEPDTRKMINCYVTRKDRTLVGVVSLRALVLEKNEQRPVEELMNPNVVSVVTSTDREDAAQLIEKYGYLALPVVDKENRLVGILTVDDAISILQDEASEDIAKMNAMTPSDKPYFKQSMLDVYKSRIPWLLFLMLSATFSSLVIRGYESALAAVTVLTAYIPMLTDAGGNAGSQSTSTIIRSMAVGDIAPHDLPRIIWRECRVALMCGVTLAVCNFFKMLLLDRIAAPVALVVCVTLIFTVLLSQLIGVLLPVIAEKFKIDPAVMASPLITTIVDTTTLLIYFNVAKMVLHI